MKNPKKILIHHTASPQEWTTHTDVNRWHQNRGYSLSAKGFYIAYHYFIGKDGKVTQARSDWERTMHTRVDYVNENSIAICLAGNFEEDKTTEAQRDAISDLLLEKTQEYGIGYDDILKHSDVQATLCPGENFNIEPYKNKVRNRNEQINALRKLTLRLVNIFKNL